MRAVSDQLEALLEANQSFYRALEALDLEAMDRVWLHDGWVRCVHPGWNVLAGWPEIRKSWERIFANTGWIRVTTTDVSAACFGELGVVACSENLSASHEEESSLAEERK